MNRTFIRAVTAAAFSLTVLAAPVYALADTSTTTNSSEIQSIKDQIKSLLDQVAKLNDRLMKISHTDGSGNASTTPSGKPCPVPPRNLVLGSHGDDVKELQQFLSQDPSLFSSTNATGFFGPVTAAAVKQFQVRNNIASSTDGSVGPRTREALGKRCGELMIKPGDLKPVGPEDHITHMSGSNEPTVEPGTVTTPGSTNKPGGGGHPTPNMDSEKTTNSVSGGH